LSARPATRRRIRLALGSLFGLALLALACGTEENLTAPSGGRVVVSRVRVFPAAALVEISRSRSFGFNVTATVPSTVYWSVDGGAGNGTITQEGVYTAPGVLPSTPTVTVRATALADSTTSGTATVTVVGEGEGQLSVSLAPADTTVETEKTQRFSVSVAGIDTTVTWSVDGGIQYGTIDADGVYTAPLWVPYPAEITVRARSVVDSDVFGLATIRVVPARS
jgi:hypothetical protein